MYKLTKPQSAAGQIPVTGKAAFQTLQGVWKPHVDNFWGAKDKRLHWAAGQCREVARGERLAESYTLDIPLYYKASSLEWDPWGETRRRGSSGFIFPWRGGGQTPSGKGSRRQVPVSCSPDSTAHWVWCLSSSNNPLLPLTKALEKWQDFVQRGCGTSTVGGVQDWTGQADLISAAFAVLSCRTSGGPFQARVLCDSIMILPAMPSNWKVRN